MLRLLTFSIKSKINPLSLEDYTQEPLEPPLPVHADGSIVSSICSFKIPAVHILPGLVLYFHTLIFLSAVFCCPVA